MTVEILSSNTIQNRDALPPFFGTTGEGEAGFVKKMQDYVSHTANFGSATGNASRQSRFPVEAKVKKVFIFTSGLDSNAAATLTLDINIAFSDMPYNDGTNLNYLGQIPQSALTGAVTTLASYTSPNNMFSSAYATANSGAVKYNEATSLNTYTPLLAFEPMWAALGGIGAATAAPFNAGGGFAQASGTGMICSPGGNFDVLVVTAHVAATAAAGTLGTEVDFVL